jgi:hypothetical protein
MAPERSPRVSWFEKAMPIMIMQGRRTRKHGNTQGPYFAPCPACYPLQLLRIVPNLADHPLLVFVDRYGHFARSFVYDSEAPLMGSEP